MLKSINKTIIIKRGINQVPQCVRRVALSKVHISCQQVDSIRNIRHEQEIMANDTNKIISLKR